MLSTVSATVVSYLFLGKSLPFQCSLSPFAMGNLPFYAILGVFCGLCSLYFVRMTLSLEDWLSGWKNPWLKWLACAAGLGLLIFLFPPLYGEGYSYLHPLLNGQAPDYGGVTGGMLRIPALVPVFFLLVLLLKVFSMTFTNAGGGVGGTFGPTLLMGAFAGFVVASSLNLLWPGKLPVSHFVLVGTAGLMAGVMQAPLTAIFLSAEISGGYALLVPLILTSATAYGVTRLFEKYSIYTKRIAASGELLTHDSDQAVLTLMRMERLLEQDFRPVYINATLRELVLAVSESQRNLFPMSTISL